MGDEFLIPPPNSVTVNSGRVVLYTHDEKPVYRQIGFGMQTSGTCPAFSDGVKKTISPKAPPKAPKFTSAPVKKAPAKRGK